MNEQSRWICRDEWAAEINAECTCPDDQEAEQDRDPRSHADCGYYRLVKYP